MEEDIAPDARGSGDDERECAGNRDRAVDLTGDQQEDDRDERKHEPANCREEE